MKKIGVVTIIDYYNYGNRLQNFAVQEVLNMLKCQADTLIIQSPPKTKNISYYIKRILQLGPQKILSVAIAKLRNTNEKELRVQRINALKGFSKNNINEKIINESSINQITNSYNYFVVGSDQIWNPNFREGNEVDFLTFTPKSKRIAYAPSFGIAEIPEEYKDRYKTWLSDMSYLSVRENAGARIIKELTGRDAEVLLDPTLMISKSKWKSISKPAKLKPLGKYLVTYFLGEIPDEQLSVVNMIASKYNLEIVHLGSLLDEERYASGLEEFLDYFHSADVIMTNSFHGTIFSILFERPFIVFDKTSKSPSMFSRIETLLTTLNLQNRQWKRFNMNDDVLDLDFKNISNILNIERKKTLDYLKEALELDMEMDQDVTGA